MPIHDWTRVDSGIFHDFHLEWISRIKRALNRGLLPEGYYALAEQQVAALEPDVLTLRGPRGVQAPPRAAAPPPAGAIGLKTAPARTSLRAEIAGEFLRRKQRAVVVRHVSGDDVVAMIEIVSPGNKDSRRAFQAFVEKATWLLQRRIHLLILDLFPPTPRDPRGVHGAIWEEVGGEAFVPPEGKPLTFVSYEAVPSTIAYIEPLAIGDPLPDMPLFLEPEGYIDVPLEATYRDALDAVPDRWRDVVAGTP